jgi:hypothetical protein
LCISWCSYSAYPPSPRVATSAGCASMWCLWACVGSTFFPCFSYYCKKKRKEPSSVVVYEKKIFATFSYYPRAGEKPKLLLSTNGR